MDKLKEMWQAASTDTKKRTIFFIIAWIFSIYSLIHNLIVNGFAIETVESLIAIILSCVASILTWWKNNSFTAEAIKADEYKEIIKDAVDKCEDIIEAVKEVTDKKEITEGESIEVETSVNKEN